FIGNGLFNFFHKVCHVASILSKSIYRFFIIITSYGLVLSNCEVSFSSKAFESFLPAPVSSYLRLLRFSDCLAPSASLHLSLGPQEVGHEGVVPRWHDLSLPSSTFESKLSSRFFQRRCQAKTALSAFLIV
ncbi:MAG: hypothetical protein R3328_02975, partial [Planococcaceae bacterium]|nr:hypothetical protein [Planococcaceae bacterium]